VPFSTVTCCPSITSVTVSISGEFYNDGNDGNDGNDPERSGTIGNDREGRARADAHFEHVGAADCRESERRAVRLFAGVGRGRFVYDLAAPANGVASTLSEMLDRV